MVFSSMKKNFLIRQPNSTKYMTKNKRKYEVNMKKFCKRASSAFYVTCKKDVLKS